MSLPDSAHPIPRPTRIAQITGLAIFALAFFLPACRNAHPIFSGADTYAGWFCAQFTLSLAVHSDGYKDYFFLAVMSGWINPLTLLYLLLSFRAKPLRARRILALAILVCIMATWTFFLIAPIVPLIGHFLWIAGALLILSPEFLLRHRAQPLPPSTLHATPPLA